MPHSPNLSNSDAARRRSPPIPRYAPLAERRALPPHLGETRGDVLRAVPVVARNFDKDEALDFAAEFGRGVLMVVIKAAAP